MTDGDFIDAYLDQIEGDTGVKSASDNQDNAQKLDSITTPLIEKRVIPVLDNEEEFSMNCRGCGVDTDAIDEYYMVQFDLWRIHVPQEFQRHVLCIGCLEGYLGRQLISEDFIEAPVNYTKDKSERLLNRMGDWFRISDGPFGNEEEFSSVVTELGKRIDGLVKREGPKYMVRIDVDTNNIVRGGLTLARLLRVVDEVKVGDTVLAHDFAEAADFFAEVVAIEGKRAYVRIDWDSANPW
jgi:hypothetical protein